METKIAIMGIEKLQVKAKLVDVPVEGGEKGETEKHLVTTVQFDYDGKPGKLDDALWTLAAGHRLDVVVSSPQASMGIDSVTISSGDKSVTLGKES